MSQSLSSEEGTFLPRGSWHLRFPLSVLVAGRTGFVCLDKPSLPVSPSRVRNRWKGDEGHQEKNRQNAESSWLPAGSWATRFELERCSAPVLPGRYPMVQSGRVFSVKSATVAQGEDRLTYTSPWQRLGKPAQRPEDTDSFLSSFFLSSLNTSLR